MNMDSLNKWLTLAANIGVMAGIFFLVIELNQDASIASAEAFQQTQSELSEWRALVLSDDELAQIWQDFVNEKDLDELPEGGRMRLGFLILNIFAVYENAYYSENYGVFGAIELEQTKFRACDEYNRAIRLGMTIPFQLMTVNYRKYLETNC